MMPQVSIVVTAYQKADFIGSTLDSVLGQSLQNWECIVVDDGSRDNTQEVTREYSARDSRIKYYYQENAGSSAARNYGAKIATGKYMMMLDGDDKLAPDYLKDAVNAFEKDQSIRLVYGAARKFGKVNKEWKLERYNYDRLHLSNMIYCSFLMRRTDFMATEGYDETMRSGLEDWEFLIRFLQRNSVVHYLEKVCFYYRQGSNAVTSNATKSQQDVFDYIVKKNIERYLGVNNPMTLCHKYERELKHTRNRSLLALLILLFNKLRKK